MNPSPMTNQTAYEKGIQGEEKALLHLTNKGMILLEKRYHSPFGEIDLVMQEGETLVFVEVKSRPKKSKTAGLWAITPQKQKRLIQTARHYLAHHPMDCMMRFDVVTIGEDGIIHLLNAFEGSEWS